MLPSLCLAMAANPFVSRFPGLPEAAGRGGADSHLASIPLAGSIGTWIVARLFLSGRSRRGNQCRAVCGPSPGRSRQWQAPAWWVRCSVER